MQRMGNSIVIILVTIWVVDKKMFQTIRDCQKELAKPTELEITST